MPTFASRLFGSSPFAAPGGAVPAPPPGDLPPDLDAAIAARYAADATLAGLGAPLRQGCAADGDRIPYVAFTQASARVVGTGVARYEKLHYRFNCFAGTAARAEAIGKAVIAAFHLQSLAFADGYLMSARWGGGATIPEHRRGVDNARVWNRSLWFTFTVGRQAP